MTTSSPDLSIVLLHDQMHDRAGAVVTTSLTLIDVHDIARSARTFGASATYIAHPSPLIRKLARTLQNHWEHGYGATYNPNRKEALEFVDIVSSLDEAIAKIEQRTGKLPTLVATSARAGGNRVSCESFREILRTDASPYLLMFGTGWGMTEELLSRASLFLEPIGSPSGYNHLSVRSACAIILDRVMGR